MRALIVGRAQGVWQEVKQAQALCQFELTIVIGKAGIDFPGPFECWVSYHGYYFPDWIKQRKQNRWPLDGIQYWTSTTGRKMRDREKLLNLRTLPCREGGSSAMLAVRVAKNRGASKIVLAGVPMQAEAGHYDQVGPWKEAEIHRAAWEQERPNLESMIRSMSGWTREVFGAPTVEWLEDRLS